MNDNSIDNQNGKAMEEHLKRSKKKTRIIAISSFIFNTVIIVIILLVYFPKMTFVTKENTVASNRIIHNNNYYQLRSVNSKSGINLYIDKIGDEDGLKILCKNIGSSQTKKAEITYIYGDDLYFRLNSEFKKINLNSCEVNNIENYFKNSMTKIVHIQYNHIYGYDMDSEVITLKEIDVTNNKLIKSKTITKKKNYVNTLFDYKNFIIYSYSNLDNSPFIAKDDDIIYDLPFEGLLTVNDNFIIIIKKDDNKKYCVKKVNILDKSEKTLECFYNNFSSINSDNNDRYFISDKKIYKYNNETEEIEELTNIDTNNIVINDLYHINNKIIITGKKYWTTEHYVEFILIYDTISSTKEEYAGHMIFNFDNGKFVFSNENDELFSY